MREAVREKLKRIKELYPPQRLARSKERWRRVWTGEPVLDRYPFVFYPAYVDYYNTVYTKEERLMLFLEEFLFRGKLEEDFIPAFFPGCKQGTIPGMLGAGEVVKDGDYTCERIIFKPEDIDNLPEPSIRPGTPAGEWLELERYFLEECEGEIPVHVCDMQGPLDVASQLWGYDNVFLAAYEEEDYYDKLMRKILEAFILLWETQKELCGDCFIPTHMYGWTWVPEEFRGASLSADSMAMLSPDFFRKYYAPYIKMLGERYGNLTVHSCGNFSAVVGELAHIPAVKAVNASQMTPQMLYHAGWPSDRMIVTKEDYNKAEDIFRFIKEKNQRVEFCIRELWPTDGKGLACRPWDWTDEDWQRIRRRNQKVADWVSGWQDAVTARRTEQKEGK